MNRPLLPARAPTHEVDRNTIAAAVFGGALILGSGAAAAGVLVASSHSAVIAVAPAAHAAPAKTTPAPVPLRP